MAKKPKTTKKKERRDPDSLVGVAWRQVGYTPPHLASVDGEIELAVVVRCRDEDRDLSRETDIGKRILQCLNFCRFLEDDTLYCYELRSCEQS
jgi:hypothetical protein